MTTNTILTMPLAAALAAIGAVATSASAQTYNYDFRMNGSDASTKSSFNNIENWVTNTGAKAAFAPRAGYTYYIGGTYQLRTPDGAANATFIGDQLIVDDDASIAWKGNKTNGEGTIPNLILRGKIIHAMDAGTGILKGNYNIPSGAIGRIVSNDSDRRTFNLDANFTGSGTLVLDVRNVNGSGGTTTGAKEIFVHGDNSAFTGPVIMEGQNGNGRVTLVNETNLCGASPAVFTPDYLTINGLTAALGNTRLASPTHGVYLGARNVTLEVGAGETAFFGGAVSGPGTLTKTGAGLLILDSTNSYSGATTISAGALAFNSLNDHSTVAVQAAGAIGGTGEVRTVTFANNGSVALAGNGYGALSLSQPGGVSLNNAKLSFDLRNSQDGAPDLLDIAGALALSGVNTISFTMPADGLSAGDYEVVKAASISGTLANLAVTKPQPDANVALQISPSNIVIKVNASLYNIALASLPAKRVASATAILPADITAAPSIGGALRVYFGENDGADNPQAWTRNETLSPANDERIYDIPVDGLTLGRTYHYRHAYVIANGEHFFAPASLSFTTVNENIPNTFRYSPTSGSTMLVWDNPAAWTPDNNGVREYPSLPGDAIQSLDNRGYKFTIPFDVSLGSIRAVGGNLYLSPTNAAHVTLTFDAGSPAATNLFQSDNVQNLFLGDWDAATRANLTVQLAQPLRVAKTGGTESRHLFNAALTGGTTANPVPIIFDRANGGGQMVVFLRNPGSDFIGDIHVGAYGAQNPVRIYAGDWLQIMESQLGANFNQGLTISDGMFGHPSNRIFLRAGSKVSLHHNQYTVYEFNREVYGTGQIRSANTDGWMDENNDPPMPLNIGAGAVFSPGEDTATGTLSLFASAVNLDPGTTFKIKVAPNRNDKIDFAIRENKPNTGAPEGGALNLAGNVEIIPALAPNERLRYGDKWEIAACANTNTVVTGKLVTDTQYFRLSAEPDATGYKIFANYLYAGTTIIVR